MLRVELQSPGPEELLQDQVKLRNQPATAQPPGFEFGSLAASMQVKSWCDMVLTANRAGL